MPYIRETIKKYRTEQPLWFWLATLVICLLGISLIVLIAVGIINDQKFHLVRTDPPAGQFAISSPVLLLYFNRPLAQSNITMNWSPAVQSSVAVSGNMVTINLLSDVTAGQTYTLTLNNVTSTSNEQLAPQTIQLHAVDVPYSQLSPTIQQEIMGHQDKGAPLSRFGIQYIGADALLTQGISQFQLDAFKQAVFLFGQSQKTPVSTATVDTTSVAATPHDPNSASTYFGITFKLKLDNKTYNANLQYSNLNLVQLTLSDSSTGTQVYDSGVLDDSQIQ